MKIVRIADGVAVEVMVVPEGMTLADCYPAEIAKACAEAPDDVDLGWLTSDGGATFTAPPKLKPAPVVPALDPVEKLRAFLTANPDVLKHIGVA